jgi:preprotein translocase subunit SecG
MSALISILIIVVCVFLILVVLIQNSKGGGLASNFSASNQVLGVKKTTETIEKITWGLAIALLVLCVSSSFISKSGASSELKDTELREKIESTPASKPVQGLPAPAGQKAPGAAKPEPATK